MNERDNARPGTGPPAPDPGLSGELVGLRTELDRHQRSTEETPNPAVDLKPGDVLQIKPEADARFGGCLLIVEEPKRFGAQGYVGVPGVPQGKRAYDRVKHGDYLWVGLAPYVVADVEAVEGEDS